MANISVCMIVKNEAGVLARCLESLGDVPDEIIVVDTGSTDATKAVAARFTDKIFDYAWADDFAAARNFSLARARCDYIYVADADEVIDEENLARFKQLKEALLPEVEVVEMAYAQFHDYQTTENFEVEYRPKLFRRLRAFQFADPIHEALRTDPVVYRSNVVVFHRPTGSHAGRDLALLGRLAAEQRPLTRLSLTVIVEENGRREQGHAGGGGRFGYEYFSDDVLDAYVRQAVTQATLNLDARPAPAGLTTVVLGPGWPGILLHEAIGHGLEGDFNRKGTSAFSGRIGEQVAAPGITVVDDGTIPLRRGSLNMDDEGEPTKRTVLIENGILRGYLFDEMNARLMNAISTGNARRESFAHLPMPRMTNTMMENGGYDSQEIIASVEDGLYAANFGGGQVDITSGQFVFSTAEAWKIEKGKLSYPVKGATLIGHGPEVLKRVSMIGNDLALDGGIGTCGKDGQSVPVGVGQPTLKIDELVVGGTDQ